MPAGVVPTIRPVKGQILRLAGDGEHPLLGRSVRGLVQGASVYLVPRDDGTVVVGATVEEQGFDTTVTAGAVYELFRDARRVVPGITELELVEARAGLRPGSPDNAPVVGATSVAGLMVATGHYRNGILLSPLTAEAVAAVAAGEEPPAEMVPFTPTRFAPAGGTGDQQGAASVTGPTTVGHDAHHRGERGGCVVAAGDHGGRAGGRWCAVARRHRRGPQPRGRAPQRLAVDRPGGRRPGGDRTAAAGG